MDPSSPRNVCKKEMFDHFEKKARETEARERKSQEKSKQVSTKSSKPSNDVTDPKSGGVLTPPITPAKNRSTSDESTSDGSTTDKSTSLTKKARSRAVPDSQSCKLSVQDKEIEATDDVKSYEGGVGKRSKDIKD